MVFQSTPRTPHRPCRSYAVLLLVTLAAYGAFAQARGQQEPRLNRLFPPQDLGLLEGPDRDSWQKPDQVMDALGIADGAEVADLGAGGGWFTVRLSRRVGPNGVVYAEDIQPKMIRAISRRARRERLDNVRPVLGTPHDPKLPAGRLEAVLIVDSYYEMDDPVALLRTAAQALRPKGRLGVIEFRTAGGGPGPPAAQRIAPSRVLEDAAEAGLRLLREEDFLDFQYMLILVPDTTEGMTAREP